MSENHKPDRYGRLLEVDALRGIAAAVVMLFHFTTRFDQLYGHEAEPLFFVPWGHFGVNLFFIISGFVIFMTLHRVSRPMDFIVSRFSRLFPAFWVAIAATYFLTHALGLPDKLVSADTAAMNLFMVHGLAKIPHVDGVYWTLEIELIFYAMALLLFMAKGLDKVHGFLLMLVGLRLVYFVAKQALDIDLSWTLSQILILPYIAWFGCGIMIYRRIYASRSTPIKDLVVLAAATTQLAIVDGFGIGLLALALSALFLAAATGKLPWLANPALNWLGAISYTLYLLHENIGWSIILISERSGLSANVAIVIAIAISCLLATALTWLVEKPVMRYIRATYRNSNREPINAKHYLPILGLFISCFFGLAFAWHGNHPQTDTLSKLVDGIYKPDESTSIACKLDDNPASLKILIIGQSNAGNHGALSISRHNNEPTEYFFEGNCYRTDGPAPGATGTGGHPWSQLAHRLEHATGKPVMLSVMAVESTRIRDWVDPGILNDRLLNLLRLQSDKGFIPDLVIWQQGEADTLAQTTRAKYLERLKTLVTLLRTNGIEVPIFVAYSSYCKGKHSESIRKAILSASVKDASIRLGPDMDMLKDQFRIDQCHLSEAGLDKVAELWSNLIINNGF